MKTILKTSIIITLLLLSAMPLAMMLPAVATTSLTITPSSGPDGTAVLITGSGFAASSAVTSPTVDGGTAGWHGSIPTGTTSTTGTLTLPATIGLVGSSTLALGAHTISISDASGNTETGTFTVVAPTITSISPSSGPAGTSVVITGSGFSSVSTGVTGGAIGAVSSPTSITVATIGGAGINSVTGGSFPTSVITSTSFNVAGVTLTGTGGTFGTAAQAVSGTFAYSGSITAGTLGTVTGTISGTFSGTVVTTGGTTATVTIIGTVTYTWSTISSMAWTGSTGTTYAIDPISGIGSVSSPNPISIAAASFTAGVGTATSGTFNPSGITTSSFAVGGVTLTAVGGSFTASATVSGSFSYSGAITAANLAVVAGTISGTFTGTAAAGGGSATVTITGAVTYASSYVAHLSSSVISSSGAYTGTVQLQGPSAGTVLAGSSTITLTDAEGNVATGTFTVVGPTFSLSASSGTVGSEITVTGTGYAPVQSISSKFAGSAITTMVPNPPYTTGAGSFAFSFTVPAAPAGSQTISVTDNLGNTYSTTFSVTPAVVVKLGTFSGTLTASGSNIGLATNTAPAAFSVTNLGFEVDMTGFPAGSTTGVAATASFSSNIKTGGTGGADDTPTAFTALTGCTVPSGTSLSVTSVTGSWSFGGQFAGGGSQQLLAGSYTVTVTMSSQSTYGTFLGVAINGKNAYTAVTTSGSVASTSVTSPIASTVTFVYFEPTATYAGTSGDTAVALDGNALSSTFITASTTSVTSYPSAGTAVTITMPSTTAGTHTLTLTVGGSGGTTVLNSVNYIVPSTAASITMNPTTGAVGNTITITGTGFLNLPSATTTPTILFAGSTLSTFSGSIDKTGVAVLTFTVPSFAPSSTPYPVTVQDSASAPYNSATAYLTVTAPSASLSSSSGNLTGTSFSITGSGFKESATGAPITLKWDGTSYNTQYATGVTDATPAGGMLLLTTGALETTIGNPAGTGWGLSGTASQQGTHTVVITDGSNTYTTTFKVVPEIAVSPTAGQPGNVLVITGDGFSATGPFSVTVNGAAASWVTSAGATTTAPNPDANGALPSTTAKGIVIPTGLAAGTYTITVSDAAATPNTASTTFTVLPTTGITLSPTSGPTGATVTVTGVGFTPTATISASNVLFNGVTVGTITGTTTVTSTGTFGTTGFSFTVPTTALPGSVTVKVTDSKGVFATNTFTVVATAITLSSSSAVYGSTVTITGTGLVGPIASASLSGTGGTFSTASLSTLTVATAGTYSATFAVPARAFGTYTLTLVDSAATPHTATASLAITPSVTLSSTSGLRGATITLNAGGGFAAGSAITATFGTTPVTLSATTTTGTGASAGSLTTTPTFTVPLLASIGVNTVTVTDASGNSAIASFNVTTPSLTISPSSGAPGQSVELIGSGFTTGTGNIFVSVGGTIVTTTPSSISGPSFVAYINIPTGASGTPAITVTDLQNNAASQTFTVTTVTPTAPTVDQTTLSTSALTQTQSGTAASTFAPGSYVKVSFSLGATSGSGTVIFRMQFQASDLTIPSLTINQEYVSSTYGTISSQWLIPSTALAGTYTAQIQIFASDGVTVLAYRTLTFTVT